MRKTLAIALCGVLAALMVVGCGGQPQVSKVPVTGAREEPQWVTKGGYAFDDIKDAFYGVGIADAERITSESMRRIAARERAKDEIAGQLRTFVMSVFKDYQEAAFTEEAGAMSQDLTERVQKSVVDETIMGARPRDTWKDPRTGDLYMVVRLGMDGVVEMTRKKIQEAERNRLRMDATKAHEELDEIIEKNRKAKR